LSFGIYPKDYEVRSKRVIRHWIAEGFVKDEKGKTLEDVAERCLTELIHRNLVQVSLLRIGKAKGCRVHDLIRDMILEKNEDLNFCKHISDTGFSSLNGIIRRLSITSTLGGLMDHIESSPVRSLLCFEKKYFIYFENRILTKYRLLKVLDL
jgi:disease resistance protein RPM1